jgi:cell wall-associated NlpC family hydrolase
MPLLRGLAIRPTIRHFRILLGALVLGSVFAGVTSAEPGTVAGKQAEAQQIMGEIQSIDGRLEQAVERWNLANVKLNRIERDLAQTQHELLIARANLKRSQRGLAMQAIAVYTTTDSNSTLEVLFGATSLDDLVTRLDTVNRVSDERASLLSDVTSFKSQVTHRAVELKRSRVQQRSIVAQRAAERRSIESQLQQRRTLLASVKTQIVRLQEQERQRSLAVANAYRPQPQPGSAGSLVGISASTPDASVAPPSRYTGVVGIAMAYIGVPYVWGGSTPAGFDCSGFVMYVYSKMGVSLPHSSYALFGAGVSVSHDQLEAGDLVFFNGLGHVGIYVGGGNFIHAPHTGDVVKISSLTGWYASTYVGARRIL